MRETHAYHISFNANWITRLSTCVEVSWPNKVFGVPFALNGLRLLVGAKLVRFKILKNSARNCRLKVSEMLGMRLFLNTEKSTLNNPGPMIVLRPMLPRMFAHEFAARAALKPLPALSQNGALSVVFGTSEMQFGLT